MADIGYTIDAYSKAFEGGARPYLFSVNFSFPFSNADLKNVEYHVRASNLPESSFEDVSIPYPGYTFKMAGNRVYNDWTLSLYVDSKTKILKNFQEWQRIIYDPKEHSYSPAIKYMQNQILSLLDGDMKPVAVYTLYGAWPRAVGAIALDYSSTEIMTLDITFAYQYYERRIDGNISDTKSGNISNTIDRNPAGSDTLNRSF